MLVGRQAELDALETLTRAAGAGRGGALVVVGEPGIGKTALLDEAARVAGAMTVLRAEGAEAETHLPFAVLRTLIEPLLAHLDRLPAAQAQALAGALDLAPPSPADRFAVALALTGLLRAAGAPLLLVLDDAQWADGASLEAVAFAARRAADLPVGFVLAARPDAVPALDGLPRLAVGGIDDGAAAELLRHEDPGLDPAVASRLVLTSAGNPLALRELTHQLSAEQRAGRAPLGIAPRPGEQLAAAFARRLAGLAADERRAVVVAAAMERGSEGWLLAALEELGLEEHTLAEAERRRVLAIADGRLRFRHPLLRAAAYHAGDDDERRAAHRALAATAKDVRRRAWHLAAAVGDADPATATALADVAQAARAVGGHAEAAEAFARAAELSAPGEARARLELEAAADLAVIGAAQRALELADRAGSAALDDLRPVAAQLRGHLRLRCGDPRGGHELLDAEAARQLAEGDPERAALLLLEAIVALTITGDRVLLDRAVTRLREAAARAGGPVAALAEATLAQHDVARGRAADGRRRHDRVLGDLEGLDPVRFAEPLALTAQSLLWLGDPGGAGLVAGRLVAALEERNAVARLAYPLGVRAQVALWRGDLVGGRADALAAEQLARDTGQDTMRSFLLAVRSRADLLAGDAGAAREAAGLALELCDRAGAHGHACYAHAALGAIEVTLGRPEAAVAPLERAAGLAEAAGFSNPALPAAAGDLVEALAETGQAEAARAGVAALAASDGGPWTAAIAARAAVTSGTPDAPAIARARTTAAALGAPLEVARTELAIGRRALRDRRRGGAREPLRQARDAFAALGAPLWVRRVDELLETVGERPAALSELGEEDRRLALLVSRGLTNDEIAAILPISSKTVERRLTIVFRRVGVGSRTALARLVTESRAAG